LFVIINCGELPDNTEPPGGLMQVCGLVHVISEYS